METLHEFLQWLIDVLTFLGLLLAAAKERPLVQSPQCQEELPASPQTPPREIEALVVETDGKAVIVVIVVIDENA